VHEVAVRTRRRPLPLEEPLVHQVVLGRADKLLGLRRIVLLALTILLRQGGVKRGRGLGAVEKFDVTEDNNLGMRK